MDFSGWWFNWEWDGSMYGDPPRWMVRGGVAAIALGATAWVVGWSSGRVAAGAMTGFLAAMLLGCLLSWSLLEERRSAAVVLGNLALAGGACALAARSTWSGGVALASYGPIALALGLPILTRIWGATLFSISLEGSSAELAARADRAEAGEGPDLLVRFEAERGEGGVRAVLVRTARCEDVVLAQALLEASLVRRATPGMHLLLEGAELGERRAVDRGSYRGGEPLRVVERAMQVHYLGPRRRGYGFRGEIAAGLLVLAVFHLTAAAATWFASV